MAVEAVITNGLPLCVIEKSSTAKMLAPVLDQLNLKLTAFNVRTWIIDIHPGKILENKQTFAGKMASVEVDLRSRKKRHFIGINL